jgi:hypothetical protein
VAELSSEFKPPEGIRVRVLFDSYYLCPVMVKACRKKGFHFVSAKMDENSKPAVTATDYFLANQRTPSASANPKVG